jgi:ketosteroid isomerase-like protein
MGVGSLDVYVKEDAMTNRNVEIVRRLIGDMNAGNAQSYLEALAEDVRYTVIGSTPFSGTHQGRDAIVAQIVMPLMEKLDGFITITPHSVFGDGDLVCVQAGGEARTKTGQPYNNTYCFVFRFRGDRIAEVTEYLDTDMVRTVLA